MLVGARPGLDKERMQPVRQPRGAGRIAAQVMQLEGRQASLLIEFAAAGLRRVLAGMAKAFEERLNLMVDRETAERETKRLVTRLKFASLCQNEP